MGAIGVAILHIHNIVILRRWGQPPPGLCGTWVEDMMAATAAGPISITIQRAYDNPAEATGYRVLVDRFWPRGRSKDVLKLDDWAKDLAPSGELIKWYGHVVERWPEFRKRYRAELRTAAARQRLDALRQAARGQHLVLVYGARDAEHNQAVVLKELLAQG